MKSEHATFQVSIADSDVVFETNEDDTILGSMLRAGIGVPYECNAGGCGSCKFTLVDGSVVDDLEESAGLRQSDRRKNKHLACICRARSDCTISVKLDSAYAPEIYPTAIAAQFISRTPLTHDLWEFHFQSTEPALFKPGQYAKLHIPGVSGPRSYSMANTANDDGIWTFQIKRVPDGEATTLLFGGALEGLVVDIDAPYSIAHLDENSKRATVCIAGGSGLAPMLSIIRGLALSGVNKTQPILYYGARTPEDIVPSTYFSDIQNFDPAQHYIPVVSDTESATNYEGSKGFVHEHLATALPEDCSDIDFYMAGPPPMVDAVRRHLVLDRKVPIEQLRYDRFF
ncbi:MAG: 2Fe-2S iron-sulfur cluster binding domain-containing protein [Rhodospirillales bacterium]|nr:2Fe-2S iron-sulfur cluster binding domain-containing protein [Rhodospirillales bacterium]MBT6109583.1 2Fe-2S iron-sulfur cluster binding domain-containing protein [Rhodospirillales bacterium]